MDVFKCVEEKFVYWFIINSIVFSFCGCWFVIGSWDKILKIWDVEFFELFKVLEIIRDKGYFNFVNWLFWIFY